MSAIQVDLNMNPLPPWPGHPGEPVVPGLFLATDPSGSNLLVSDTAMRVDVVNVASGSVTEIPVLGEATNARLVSVAW
jgi:hypothetical protein